MRHSFPEKNYFVRRFLLLCRFRGVYFNRIPTEKECGRTLPCISEVCSGYILHVNYESIQTCNEYNNRCIHNRWGVFLKTNLVLGGVQASVTKL